MQLSIYQIDTFANKVFEGNPAAVCPLENWLPDEFCKDFDHVDVELRVKEYGFNHWLNVFFKAEQATDGFKFMLSCEDNITIQTYNLFDVGHNYHIDLSEDKKELHISCYQWINEGAGLSIITSQPEVGNA